MTTALIALVLILALTTTVLAAPRLRRRRGHAEPPRAPAGRRILFPFVAEDLSQRALDAALRLAAAEQATLVPAFLARVSLDLPLDTPLPRQCSLAMPLLEAIEQRATDAGVGVDARIERGRNRRHALRQAIATEPFDRIVIAAAAHGSLGFDADDVAWLLENAPGEIVVLRPSASVPGSSIVQVQRQDRDDHVRPRLEHRGQQPCPLVVEDLVPSLARDDLGD